MGGVREGLYWYTYLKHIIQLWPGDWVKHMEEINEAVGMNNHLTIVGGGKQIVCPFRIKELWECVGWIILAVTYGKKGHKLWSSAPKYFGINAPTKLQKYCLGNTNLYKLCCDIYRNFYIYACHWFILYYTTLFISWIILWLITSLYYYRFAIYPWKGLMSSGRFWPCYFVYLLVKSTNNFWKVHGLIDGFNELRRQIASGVGNW